MRPEGSSHGCQGPPFFDLHGFRIDFYYFTFVFDVRVQTTFTIDYRNSGFPSNARAPATAPVAASITVASPAAPIENEYTFAVRIVDNAIRISAGLHALQFSARFGVEYDNYIRTSVTDETTMKVISNGDAVDAIHPTNRRDCFLRIEIDDLYVIAVGNIQQARFRVGKKIIPPFFPRETKYD